MSVGDRVIVTPQKLHGAAPWRGRVVGLPGMRLARPKTEEAPRGPLCEVPPGKLAIQPLGRGLSSLPVVVPRSIVRPALEAV